jgi:hypothetical protein
MPFELQVIRASEFVRLGAHDELNFEASREALQLLARACCKRGVDGALLDLRALPIPPKPVFTPAQLAALVETFGGVGFTKRHRLAVLYSVDLHGGAHMFAFISRRHGWQVQAFGDFEPAMLWLSGSDGKSAESEGEAIPIHHKRSKSAAPSTI